MQYTRIIGFTLIVLVLQACGQADSICACIEVSDALNKKSSEVLNRTPTSKDEKELQELRKRKKQKCAAFETMSGPEMLERKSSCD